MRGDGRVRLFRCCPELIVLPGDLGVAGGKSKQMDAADARFLRSSQELGRRVVDARYRDDRGAPETIRSEGAVIGKPVVIGPTDGEAELAILEGARDQRRLRAKQQLRVHAVQLVVTEIAVIAVTDKGFELQQYAPGYTIEDIQAVTAAPLIISPDLKPAIQAPGGV